MWSPCFSCECTRDQKNLSACQRQFPIQFWEAQIIRHWQTKIADWRKAWLNVLLALDLELNFVHICSSLWLELCVVEMHLSVLPAYLAFWVYDEMSLVVGHVLALGARKVRVDWLWETTEWNPNLVLQGQLLVFLEPLAMFWALAPNDSTSSRLKRKFIGQTNQFSTFLDAIFNVTLDLLEIGFQVLTRVQLDDANKRLNFVSGCV